MNSSSKSAQIEGQNLEYGRKCCTFALSIRNKCAHDDERHEKRDVGHPMQLVAKESNTTKNILRSMAKILYEVKQCQNEHSAANGRWFAWVRTLETMNTRRLAQHIAEHGSIYTPDVVYGVLEKFRSCLVEMLLDSKKVKIEGLGTFYTTLENIKRGALKKEDYNPSKHMKALHIRFLPEQTTEENISSREFLKKAEFINIDSLTKSEEEQSSASGGSQSGGTESGDSQTGGDSGSGGFNMGGGE